MRSRARLLGQAALVAVLVGAAPASAETPPDVWTRAKVPSAKQSYDLHLVVAGLLRRHYNQQNRPSPFFGGGSDNLWLGRARMLLEQARANDQSDVLLAFDLGTVYEGLLLHHEAIAVLEPALAAAPDHPAAEDAWFQLALAYAKLDRPADERRAYVAYLERASQAGSRSTALLNLAETEMRLGRLGESIAAYREAMAYSKDFPRTHDTYTLAVWGLAVSLDRYGDTTAAAREAENATRLDVGDHIISDTSRVFFVPEYERNWYLGLGSAARARLATDPRVALRYAQKAEAHFSDYVARAVTGKDRWKALAERRLAAARAERQRIQSVVSKLPRPTRDDDTFVF